MGVKACMCGKESKEEVCSVCAERESSRYWCESCLQIVTEKRCPLCGLKARKVRADDSERTV